MKRSKAPTKKRKKSTDANPRPKKRRKLDQLEIFKRVYQKMTDKQRMEHAKMLIDASTNKMFFLKSFLSLGFVESYTCLYNDLEEGSKDLFTRKYAFQKLKNTIYPDLII